MKKLLLALLAVSALAAFAPKAEAGQYAVVYTKYGVTYVPKATLYGQSYIDEVNYNNAYNQSRCRPQPRTYYRPSSTTRYYSRPVSYRSCDTYRAPRISFSFGF